MSRRRHWSYRGEKQRRRVLARDNRECQLRLPGCTVFATTVDHIHPKAWGGTEDDRNLQAACKECNQKKGARGVFKGGVYSRAPLRKIPPHDSRYAVTPRDFSRKAPE